MHFRQVLIVYVTFLGVAIPQSDSLPASEINRNPSLNEVEDEHLEITRPLLRLYNKYPENATFTIETSENRASIISYWPDLNDIAGFCATGTWVLYSLSNYGSGGVGGLVYSNSNITCAGRSWPTTASFRFAGSPANIHANTLTTYRGVGYRADSSLYESEANITDSFNSFIVTGTYPITFFSRENFGGFSMCVDAPANGLGGGLREVTRDLGLLPEEIKSFRFGCPEGVLRIPLEKNFG